MTLTRIPTILLRQNRTTANFKRPTLKLADLGSRLNNQIYKTKFILILDNIRNLKIYIGSSHSASKIIFFKYIYGNKNLFETKYWNKINRQHGIDFGNNNYSR